MKKRIYLFTIALISLIFISSSCKKEEENIEESAGVIFSVNGDDAWSTKNVSTKDNTSNFVITATKDNYKLVLTIKELKVGKYYLDDTKNTATYTSGGKEFIASKSHDNYIEIKGMHTDGKTFAGAFSFTSISADANIKSIHGSWDNVK